jgi:DNA-binding winged helix-turn-helix (wHTH) protein
MIDVEPVRGYRFGVFEADAASGELRRQGIRIKLNAQPFQVLLLLLERRGGLLTREEISRELWPEGTFVDYEHGVNSAINRIREALGDTAGNPRFVETLARRGYRFIAPVERIGAPEEAPAAGPATPSTPASAEAEPQSPAPGQRRPPRRILTSAEDLPHVPSHVVQTLFVLFQLMYLAFYIGALANLPEIADLFSVLPWPVVALGVVTVTAALLIPVRAFALCATLFRPPGAAGKLLKLWRLLLPADVLWALSPFLLLHHINFGLAVSCMALLVYSPFAQRSLVLMGAGQKQGHVPVGAHGLGTPE